MKEVQVAVDEELGLSNPLLRIEHDRIGNSFNSRRQMFAKHFFDVRSVGVMNGEAFHSGDEQMRFTRERGKGLPASVEAEKRNVRRCAQIQTESERRSMPRLSVRR